MLFQRGDGIGNDIRNQVGILAVRFHITLADDGLWAHAPGQLHGHGRVNTKCARFIAAGSHYSPVAAATNDYRLSFKAVVFQAFYGYKKVSRSKCAICLCEGMIILVRGLRRFFLCSRSFP